ncbi:MAG: DUF192 domain-containing protein [Bryobacteraceae bacterium]
MTGRVQPSDPNLLVRNVTKGTILCDRGLAADTSEKRRTGLLKHKSLPEGEGLWIVPCEGVHTFGMNFPIDVVYLNKKRVVVKLRPNMVKRRMSFCLRAHSVLELPTGMIAKTQTAVGDQLELIRGDKA